MCVCICCIVKYPTGTTASYCFFPLCFLHLMQCHDSPMHTWYINAHTIDQHPHNTRRREIHITESKKYKWLEKYMLQNQRNICFIIRKFDTQIAHCTHFWPMYLGVGDIEKSLIWVIEVKYSFIISQQNIEK